MKIMQAKVVQDFCSGVMVGEEVATSTKLFKDAKTLYINSDCNISDDEVMYEVYTYSQGDAQQVGNLNWGLTIMKPVFVNQECNMTRGHFHENLDCAEIYFCLQGKGYLLFMDENDTCFAEEMSEGSVHHIDGKLAHRLVNIGDNELKVGACWPTTSGHDYKRVEEHPFQVRIYKENDKIIVKEMR
ncbi:MAG: glucose-6-phosphate isomerase family protein [Longicatena sp.]